MSEPILPRMTAEEYLALERNAETKSEFVGGEIFAMSGASKEHNRIVNDFSTQLNNRISTIGCEVFSSDQRVKINPFGDYVYPDIVAVCDEAEFDETELDSLINPQIITEVLSPSTQVYDRTTKLDLYRQIPTLQEYIMVAQDKPLIEHYVRQKDNQWTVTTIVGLESVLHLASVDCSLRFTEIYRRVKFS